MFGDDRTVATPLEIAGDHQALNGFAHGGAGDAKLLTEQTLCRQGGTGRQLAGVDRVSQSLTNLRRNGLASDRIK